LFIFVPIINPLTFLQMAKFIKVQVQRVLDSGTDATGTPNKLTVASTATFKIGDIVRNTTDSTWATITAIDSATVASISADIMDAAETYVVYSATSYVDKPLLAEGIALVKQASTSTTTITYTAGSTSADVITLTHQPLSSALLTSVEDAIDAAVLSVHSNGQRPDVAKEVSLPTGINVVAVAIA
jgi:hypothetical protein